jgi:hypothetical protein
VSAAGRRHDARLADIVAAMRMGPRLRKLVLVTHVVTSVGWIGAVAVVLVLIVVGLTSRDFDTTRAVYLVLEPAAWFGLVPLALASLLVGIVQSLGSRWGLLKHYWVLFKLFITLFSTIVLLFYMRTFELMAEWAADPGTDLAALRNPSPLVHGVAALLLLLTAAALSVYKPAGTTTRRRLR